MNRKKKKKTTQNKNQNPLATQWEDFTAQMIFCAELQEGLQKFIKNQSCREPGILSVFCYDQDINKSSFKF